MLIKVNTIRCTFLKSIHALNDSINGKIMSVIIKGNMYCIELHISIDFTLIHTNSIYRISTIGNSVLY